MGAILNELVIVPEKPESDQAQSLMNRMYQELTPLYGGTAEGRFSQLDFRQGGSVFVIARIGDQPIACGALVWLEENVAEIKRMFVEPAWRGRGVARVVLADLERRARTFGYRKLRLETGIRQPTAIGLYESAGYQRIPPYGRHVGDLLSVCFEKEMLV